MNNFLAPHYMRDVSVAGKCRLAVGKNRDYVNRYLKYFSERETLTAFELRKSITPNPPDLRIGMNQLMYSIRARMGDVSRGSNLAEYIDAANGVKDGVDGKGSTMVSFMANEVLFELLVAKKVGIFVNRQEVPQTIEKQAPWPFLSIVPIEDIYNISTDANGKVNGVILRTYEDEQEDGFSIKESYFIDKYKLTDGQLVHTRFNSAGVELSKTASDMDVLPFAYLSIKDSPVEDALDLHDALLQLSSSDFIFLFKSNHPIYVEQFSVQSEMQKKQEARFKDSPGQDGKTDTANKEIDVGVVTGRRYAAGLDAPQFISPQVDHLQASELKQEKLAKQIERMLTIESFNKGYKQASAESKQEDKEPLIGNIQRLFDTFETAEKDIATAWHAYYNVAPDFSVEYPTSFDLRTEEARLKTAENRLKLRDDVPSRTFKDTVTLEAVRDILPTASLADIRLIEREIKAAQLNVSTPALIKLMHENGLHPEHVLTALGLDKKEATRVIEFTREKMEFITKTQTGNINVPGERNSKPEGTDDD